MTPGVLTVTVMVVIVAHWPASGVKVYMVVVELSIAGVHVPVIALLEVLDKLKDPPTQMADTCVNTGIVG